MNIPETILRKARLASKLTEEQFAEYLTQLQREAEVYCLNFFITNEVSEEVLALCIDLYVQYSLFSKIEYEEIGRDKLDTLHSIIASFNANYEKKTPIISKGVRFI